LFGLFDLAQARQALNLLIVLQWRHSFIAARIRASTMQGWSAEEVPADEAIYETITCIACQQIHLVNPATGHVLTGGDDT
jgi:hypothetical protein